MADTLFASALNGVALSLRSQQPPVGDTYLHVQLDANTSAIFWMRHVQEACVLPMNRLTAMPGMPPYILGLINRRSRVFWVADLPQLLNLQPIKMNARQCDIVILNVAGLSLAVAVAGIRSTLRLTPDRIQSPIHPSAIGIGAYLYGCVLHDNEIIQVLNVEAILNSPSLLNP